MDPNWLNWVILKFRIKGNTNKLAIKIRSPDSGPNDPLSLRVWGALKALNQCVELTPFSQLDASFVSFRIQLTLVITSYTEAATV